MDEADELVSVLPIHYNDSLASQLQVHQFPLLTRPLQPPPSAVLSGKRITARYKPSARRFEIHVPVDTRPEVYNVEKSKELGVGRIEDDREKNQARNTREDEDPRLTEVRLRSEEIPQRSAQVLGIVKGGKYCYKPYTISSCNDFISPGKLHLHPISQVHQLRPTLTYLDILSRKNRKRGGAGSDSDSDEGPPPDPDEVPLPVAAPKKEKKTVSDVKEVHATARKVDDQAQGGLSTVRREMLHIMREEEDERWTNLEFFDVTTDESSTVFESLFSQSDEVLTSEGSMTDYIKSIKGL